MHSITALKRLMNLKQLMILLLVLTVLCSLTATRAAHAQGLNLGYYSNYLTLTNQDTNQSYGASLQVTQDSQGNLSGWMTVDNTQYQVTGTLTWYGSYDPDWYWLDITATWSNDAPWWELPVRSQIYLSDWVYDDGGWPQFYTGDYSWYNEIGWSVPTNPSTGTFSGYGFVPPR